MVIGNNINELFQVNNTLSSEIQPENNTGIYKTNGLSSILKIFLLFSF